MAEKTLNTRVVLKHDSDTNWAATGAAGKGANFVPKSGEVIVYEYSDGSRKFKIGNGKSTAAALPFQNTVGPTGPKGDKGATGAAATIAVGTVTTGAAGSSATVTNAGTSSAAKFNFTIPRGNTGAAGTRGSRWSTGTAVTGTSTTAAVFSGTGIADALVNDMYLNTSTGYIYRCTVAGAANVAKWVYEGSIKGIQGNTGTTPKVTASASVDANSGTPSVTVTQNGSDAAPTFAFAFKNLRGAKGSDGVGVITNLNGSTTTDRTAYAPTTAGTSGYYLKSNGSGAPTWTSLTSLKNPNALTLTVNGTKTSYDGSTIESESWYAPTTAGTSGYYLVSSGSGAPTWSEGIDDGDID